MIVVTVGGVLVGISVFAWHAIQWFPGLEKLKGHPLPYLGDWLPFLFGWAYGALGVLTTMGLLGWLFDTALWISNWLGDAAIWLGVGEAPGQTAAGAPVQLSGLGSVAVLFATVVVIAVIKFRPSGPSLKRGVWCGLCLGTSGHIAGAVAGPLAMGANWLGQSTFGAA